MTPKTPTKNNSQQPEELTCQGEGEFTDRNKTSSEHLGTGKPKKYPSADTNNKTPIEKENERMTYRDLMYLFLGILCGIAITLLWMNTGWIR